MAARRPKTARQLELTLPTWGGRRDGAGCKRRSSRPMVAHDVRESVRGYEPVLVTMRVRDGVPDLRERRAWETIVAVFRRLRGRAGFRLVHYSVLRNHLHAIVEADDRTALARGMLVYTTQLAKALNRLFDRRGPVFVGRYHARSLTSPTEVRNALRYVLLNARHHAHDVAIALPHDWIDPRSTALAFDGWRNPPAGVPSSTDYGTSPAETWLLRVGWRRGGLLDPNEIPGARLRAELRGSGPSRPS